MLRTLAWASTAVALSATPAMAQTSERDLEVIGRVMSFLQGAEGSDRTILVAHSADGTAEAQALEAMMAGGMSAGRVTLNGRAISASDTAALAGADAVILVGSAEADEALRVAAASSGVLTVSSHTECASAGTCMLGIASSPSVRIVVNRSALEGAGISFDPAFVLMIEEV